MHVHFYIHKICLFYTVYVFKPHPFLLIIIIYDILIHSYKNDTDNMNRLIHSYKNDTDNMNRL